MLCIVQGTVSIVIHCGQECVGCVRHCFTEDFLSTYFCLHLWYLLPNTEPSVRRDQFSMTGVSSTMPDCYTFVPGPSGLQPVVGVHEAAARAVSEAGGWISTNGSGDMLVRPKKRPRKPDTWKKNVAKLKRARGEEYISLTVEECSHHAKQEKHASASVDDVLNTSLIMKRKIFSASWITLPIKRYRMRTFSGWSLLQLWNVEDLEERLG